MIYGESFSIGNPCSLHMPPFPPPPADTASDKEQPFFTPFETNHLRSVLFNVLINVRFGGTGGGKGANWASDTNMPAV